MTNEEAIKNLKWLLECSYVDSFSDEENKALDMGIKALEREKVGHWINSKHTSSIYCSECDCSLYEEEVNGELNYCPNCGARMI